MSDKTVINQSNNLENIKNDKVIFYMFILCVTILLTIIIVDLTLVPTLWEPVYIEKEEIIVHSSLSESISINDSIFPIKINTATSEELQNIPDIGPKTAKLIVDYRDINGTIVDFDDLLSIDGIGKKTVETIKKYCVIN